MGVLLVPCQTPNLGGGGGASGMGGTFQNYFQTWEKNKRVICHLKCKILTNNPELATEGIVKNMLLDTNDSNKNLKRQRQVSSNSSIVIQQVHKKINRRQSNNSTIANSDTQNNTDQYQVNLTTQTHTQTESSCSFQENSN